MNMKKILYSAAACLVLAMFLLYCYIISKVWMVLVASAFLFGLAIGLFFAFWYEDRQEARRIEEYFDERESFHHND